MEYTFRPRGVCPSRIDFTIDGNVIRGIRFTGGCNGNLKAIGKLLEGKTVEEIESALRGNTCGFKATSCADQLAIAVREAYDAQRTR